MSGLSKKPSETLIWTPRNLALVLLFVCGLAASAAAILLASEIFLTLLLAVLFAVFLTKSSDTLSRWLKLSYRWSLGIFSSCFVGLMFGALLLFGVQVESQISKAATQLNKAIAQVQRMADRHSSVRSVLVSTPIVRELLTLEPAEGERGKNEQDTNEKTGSSLQRKQDGDSDVVSLVETDAFSSATLDALGVLAGLFRTSFGLLVNSALIFFVGLFLAGSPAAHRDGLVILLPADKRERVREVLNMIADTLWNWLLGRFGSMLITGLGASVILASLGVPLAITVGIVTALLTFIPNIGGILALLFAVLLSLPSGGTVAVAVLIGYLVLQLLESYIVTPLIQQHQVSLSPAMLIAFQAVMGVLFGFLGAAVASPLLAAMKVTVEQLYVQDILESKYL